LGGDKEGRRKKAVPALNGNACCSLAQNRGGESWCRQKPYYTKNQRVQMGRRGPSGRFSSPPGGKTERVPITGTEEEEERAKGKVSSLPGPTS